MAPNVERTPNALFQYNLLRLIDENQYTTCSFADDIGFARSAVSLYMNGKRFPSPEILQRFSDFFCVPVSYFFKSPQEHQKDLQATVQFDSGTVFTLNDATTADNLVYTLDQYAKSDKSKHFHFLLATDRLNPYAFKNDVLHCSLPSDNLPDGSLILLAKGSILALYRAYHQKRGYLLISEKTPSVPLYLSQEDTDIRILAVVHERTHSF